MNTVDPRERFGATADAYRLYRPTYPPGVIDWILTTAGLVPGPGVTIADVGCGTGISTRLLAARGCDVIGIDPNETMLDHARRDGGARYQRGEAAATGLPDRSVDLVTAFQAFHWFDIPQTLAELRRILRPGGWCVAVWNLRGGGAFMDAYDQLLRAHSAEYEVLLKPLQTVDRLEAHPDVTDTREAEFTHVQPLDRTGLFGRVFSSSYVTHGLSDRPTFESRLNALFDRHQRNGVVEFPYRTIAFAWCAGGTR